MTTQNQLTLITNYAYDRGITFYSETKTVEEFEKETHEFIQDVTKQVAKPVLTKLEIQLSNLIKELLPLYQKTKIAYENRINIDPNASRQEKAKLTRIAKKYARLLNHVIFNNIHNQLPNETSEYKELLGDALEIYYCQITNIDDIYDYLTLNEIPKIMKIAKDFIMATNNKELEDITLAVLTKNCLNTENLKTWWRYRENETISIFKNSHLLKIELSKKKSTSYLEYMTNLNWKYTKNVITRNITNTDI